MMSEENKLDLSNTINKVIKQEHIVDNGNESELEELRNHVTRVKDEEIPLSAAEIRTLVENALREFANTYEKKFFVVKEEKECSDYFLNQQMKQTTARLSASNYNAENSQNEEVSYKKEIPRWDREGKPRYEHFSDHEERKYDNRMNINNEISSNIDNRRKTITTLEDGEFIRKHQEPVEIGKQYIYRPQLLSVMDKTGEIIRVKDVYGKHPTNPKYHNEEVGCMRRHNYTKEMYDRENGIPEVASRDNLSHHAPEVKKKSKRYRNTLSLKWEFDGDEFVCKPVEDQSGSSSEESPRLENNDWLEFKPERNRVFYHPYMHMKNLSMNKKNGIFYIDRNLVDYYQEELAVCKRNPTSILYEICKKCYWFGPTYKFTKNGEGYFASVEVNGEQFSRVYGNTKKGTKNLASLECLKSIGLQCSFEHNQYQYTDKSYHSDSEEELSRIYSKSRKFQEWDRGYRSRPTKSCSYSVQNRNGRYEKIQEGRGKNKYFTLRCRAGQNHQLRSPSPLSQKTKCKPTIEIFL